MEIIGRKREANMDMLRIFSMLLIIGLHSIDHSGVLEASCSQHILTEWYVRFGYALTQICVNCFVLISGYFLVNSKFKVSKLIVLWMETVFYAVGCRLIFILLSIKEFSLKTLVSCFFPFLTGRYWFITIYAGLYILSPFLNEFIHSMTKEMHGKLIIVLGILFSLWNSIHPGIAGMNSGGGWGLAWFVVLYITAAWFRLYSFPQTYVRNWVYFAYWLGCAIIIMSVGYIISKENTLLRDIFGHWYRYDSVWAYTASVALLIFFKNVKVKNNWIEKIVTLVAPATFGVYLLHAHADASPWIWNSLNLPNYLGLRIFPMIQVLCVIGIFVVCVAIDLIRKYTVGNLEKVVLALEVKK